MEGRDSGAEALLAGHILDLPAADHDNARKMKREAVFR